MILHDQSDASLVLPVLAAAADVTGFWNLKLIRFGEEFRSR